MGQLAQSVPAKIFMLCLLAQQNMLEKVGGVKLVVHLSQGVK